MSRSRRKYIYPGVPEEPGFYVYELWADDVCLYVGRVGNSGPQLMYRRLAQHRSTQPWFPQVTRVVVSAFSSHDEIAVEEPRRITALEPIHNRAYAPRCRRGHLKPVMENNYDRPACPECYQAWNVEYQAAYRQQPERQQKERARDAGHARRTYYNGRNALPEVKARKKRWALRTARKPGPGQAGLF